MKLPGIPDVAAESGWYKVRMAHSSPSILIGVPMLATLLESLPAGSKPIYW